MCLQSKSGISDQNTLTRLVRNAVYEQQKKGIASRTSTFDNLLMPGLTCEDQSAIGEHTGPCFSKLVVFVQLRLR